MVALFLVEKSEKDFNTYIKNDGSFRFVVRWDKKTKSFFFIICMRDMNRVFSNAFSYKRKKNNFSPNCRRIATELQFTMVTKVEGLANQTPFNI